MNETLAYHRAPAAPQDDEIDLLELWGLLYRGKWVIAACTIVVLLLGAVYALAQPPVYRSSAAIQMMPEQISGVSERLASVSAQAVIMTSEPVLSRVVEQLGLDVVAEPKRRFFASPMFDNSRQTAIEVTAFTPPRGLYGKAFTIHAETADEYTLYGPQRSKILTASVGTAASGKTKLGATVKITVHKLDMVDAGASFTVMRKWPRQAMEDLREALTVTTDDSSAGLMRLSGKSDSSHRVAAILDAVLDSYMRRSSAALKSQVRENLEELAQRLQRADSDLAKLNAKLRDYKKTSENPAADDASDTLELLRTKIVALEEKHSELESQRAEQKRIIDSAKPRNARIIAHATAPHIPEPAKTKLILALALILGLMLGCGIVLLRAALRRQVSDPRRIERQLGLPLVASIPHDKRIAKAGQPPAALFARSHGDAAATEALRSLRTYLSYRRKHQDSNITLLTAPDQGSGCSTISANLGFLLGAAGYKVAVVDADMRNGRLHTLFGQDASPGLATVLTGETLLDQALQATASDNCQLLAAGVVPANPSELLMSTAFADLLTRLQAEFDYVVISAPPMLAATDAAIIAGAHADITTLLVTRAGQSTQDAIEATCQRLSHSGNGPVGIVFNADKADYANAVDPAPPRRRPA